MNPQLVPNPEKQEEIWKNFEK